MTENELSRIEEMAEAATKTISTHYSKCYLSHKICALHALVAEVRRLKGTLVKTADAMLGGHTPTEEEWREWKRKFSS